MLESKSNLIFVESKFTESRPGSCSQTSRTKRGLRQCTGDYMYQINPVNSKMAKCALSGKGIRYWEYIEKTMVFDLSENFCPCPFKGSDYQLMRNVCAAEAYGELVSKPYNVFLFHIGEGLFSIDKKVSSGMLTCFNQYSKTGQPLIKDFEYMKFLAAVIRMLEIIDINETRVWEDLLEWVKSKIEKSI